MVRPEAQVHQAAVLRVVVVILGLLSRVVEVIDKYDPAMLRFDGI